MLLCLRAVWVCRDGGIVGEDHCRGFGRVGGEIVACRIAIIRGGMMRLLGLCLEAFFDRVGRASRYGTLRSAMITLFAAASFRLAFGVVENDRLSVPNSW